MIRSLLAMLAVALAAAQPLSAQESDGSLRVEERVDQALQPLTEAEVRDATSVLQSDPRARERLAGNQRVRTVSVERHEQDKGEPAPPRRADVVLYNYDTNETISAVVSLGPRPAVERLVVTRDQPPDLAAEEVEEAQRLALAHPTVQAELRAVGLAARESELLITHMLIEATAPDLCASQRCVVLFFNTRDAVLDIEPIVNLTTGEVRVQ